MKARTSPGVVSWSEEEHEETPRRRGEINRTILRKRHERNKKACFKTEEPIDLTEDDTMDINELNKGKEEEGRYSEYQDSEEENSKRVTRSSGRKKSIYAYRISSEEDEEAASSVSASTSSVKQSIKKKQKKGRMLN